MVARQIPFPNRYTPLYLLLPPLTDLRFWAFWTEVASRRLDRWLFRPSPSTWSAPRSPSRKVCINSLRYFPFPRRTLVLAYQFVPPWLAKACHLCFMTARKSTGSTRATFPLVSG